MNDRAVNLLAGLGFLVCAWECYRRGVELVTLALTETDETAEEETTTDDAD